MVSFTEELVLNPRFKGWRAYRIEYSSEDNTPEGIIFLPEAVDAGLLEDFINRLIQE